jgi:hypothetical protein
MRDDLQSLSHQMFADHIDGLYQDRRIETYSPGEDWVQLPVVGLFHRIGDETAAAAFKELDRLALAAQERFKTDGPPWAQPLPVSWQKLCKLAQIGKLVEDGVIAQDPNNGRLELMATFAASWCNSKWDPEHPGAYRFCRGLMAARNTPARLRNDPELRRLFPPKRLPGLLSEQEAWALHHSAVYERVKAAKRAGKQTLIDD